MTNDNNYYDYDDNDNNIFLEILIKNISFEL